MVSGQVRRALHRERLIEGHVDRDRLADVVGVPRRRAGGDGDVRHHRVGHHREGEGERRRVAVGVGGGEGVGGRGGGGGRRAGDRLRGGAPGKPGRQAQGRGRARPGQCVAHGPVAAGRGREPVVRPQVQEVAPCRLRRRREGGRRVRHADVRVVGDGVGAETDHGVLALGVADVTAAQGQRVGGHRDAVAVVVAGLQLVVEPGDVHVPGLVCAVREDPAEERIVDGLAGGGADAERDVRRAGNGHGLIEGHLDVHQGRGVPVVVGLPGVRPAVRLDAPAAPQPVRMELHPGDLRRGGDLVAGLRGEGVGAEAEARILALGVADGGAVQGEGAGGDSDAVRVPVGGPPACSGTRSCSRRWCGSPPPAAWRPRRTGPVAARRSPSAPGRRSRRR